MGTDFNRKSIRLRNYDYAQPGAYFITVCVKDGKCLLGDIKEGTTHLNLSGEIIQQCWNDLPNHYPYANLDSFVIMPNHVHGIIFLTNRQDQSDVGAGFPRPSNDGEFGTGEGTSPLRRCTLGQIVAYFKYQSTKQINTACHTPGLSIWRRGYYEHVIRNENELFETRKYIQENPKKWDLDPENPAFDPEKMARSRLGTGEETSPLQNPETAMQDKPQHNVGAGPVSANVGAGFPRPTELINHPGAETAPLQNPATAMHNKIQHKVGAGFPRPTELTNCSGEGTSPLQNPESSITYKEI